MSVKPGSPTLRPRNGGVRERAAQARAPGATSCSTPGNSSRKKATQTRARTKWCACEGHQRRAVPSLRQQARAVSRGCRRHGARAGRADDAAARKHGTLSKNSRRHAARTSTRASIRTSRASLWSKRRSCSAGKSGARSPISTRSLPSPPTGIGRCEKRHGRAPREMAHVLLGR